MKITFDSPKKCMKLLFLLLISLFSTATAFSQWKKVESGVTQNLWDVQFVNDTLGFAVGWNSTILKTIDGGTIWTPQTVLAGQRLYGVYFKDELNGYAVGKSETSTDGRYLYTTDGGKNWIKKTPFPLPATDVPWYSIAFSKDKQYGIIVGLDGQIAYSPDGGDNWYKRANTKNGTDPGTIYDVAFYDGNNAIAVGYWGGGSTGFIIKTSNGGNTWETINNNIAGGLYSVSFSDKSNGIAVGSGGVIYKTIDSGNNWVSMNSPTTQTLFGVHFYKNNVTAVGASGVIINSADAGLDWAQQATSNTNDLRSVFKLNGSTTIAVGVLGTILYNKPPLKVSNLRGDKEFKTLNIEGLSIAADGSTSTLFKYEYLGSDKKKHKFNI